MIHALAWYHAIAYSDHCQSTVTLQEKNTFCSHTHPTIQAECALLRRGHLSLHLWVAAADGRSISAVSSQGRPDKGWRKASAVRSLQLWLPFSLQKSFQQRVVPFRAQHRTHCCLGSLTKYVLEGLLRTRRCYAQVQCPPLKFALASPRHHLPFLTFFFSPISREVKFSKQWKCGFYTSILGERRKEPRKRAFYSP